MGVRSTPIDSISTSTVSPGRRYCGGVMAAPTPAMVPVAITSPGSRQCRHLAIDIADGRQPAIDHALAARGTPRDVALIMPFHAVAPRTLPGTELVLTFPERLAGHFVDTSKTRILEAPARDRNDDVPPGLAPPGRPRPSAPLAPRLGPGSRTRHGSPSLTHLAIEGITTVLSGSHGRGYHHDDKPDQELLTTAPLRRLPPRRRAGQPNPARRVRFAAQPAAERLQVRKFTSTRRCTGSPATCGASSRLAGAVRDESCGGLHPGTIRF